MTDAALTLRLWLSPPTAWAFKACEREQQCWAERLVSLPTAGEPRFWCKSHLPARISGHVWIGSEPKMVVLTRKIRVMIVDDHAILRAGLRMLVNAQADMEVVSEAPDGEKAIQKVQESKPDVTLLDLTMPRVSGMKRCRRLRETAA